MKSGDVTETVQDLEAEFNPNDQELCHAATKIQASFRGHMARKQVPATKGQPEDDLSKELQKLDAKTDDAPANLTTSRSNRTPEQQKQDEEDIADIDLGDPDLRKAASKIQATFRKKITIPKKSAGETRKPEVAGGKPE